MATTTLRHPNHHHPLVPLVLSNESITRSCRLCRRKISAEAYTCREGCDSYYHRVCVEAPPRIERHPLHPNHPLPLIHQRPIFTCDCCNGFFNRGGSSFKCYECNFDLDICCALSILSDQGGSQGGKTSEHITLPLHPHPLTSFFTRHDFVVDSDCNICRGTVEGDGYMCLRHLCEFIIHKGCIRDTYYADGTKAPRFYHSHPLETVVGDDAGSRTCSSCGSDKAGEFMGCSHCEVFTHRDCVQMPEFLEYRPHHPDHTLVLFINCPGNHKLRCGSCSGFLKGELCYRCTSCEFAVHVGCALRVIAYCEEGMNVEINMSFHEHSLLLCHRTESASDDCYYCGYGLNGPTYACKAQDCGFILHKSCAEIDWKINYLYHPDHPLSLSKVPPGSSPSCEACCNLIHGYCFSCRLCAFYLHPRCATRIPSHKHCLHEHELLRFDEFLPLECNRCGTSTDSPLLRCVPCNFNIHEKCTELPQVVKSEIHWHSLTLHETFVEDDSGEYYCEHCEKTRDERLGVYVCGECKISIPRIYHVECVLPELQKVYTKKGQTSAVKRLAERIATKNEEVSAAKEKLEEVERELDELVKRHAELVSNEEKKFYVVATEGGEPEKSA